MEQKASGPTAELARRDNEREEKERRKSMKKEPTFKENRTGEQESSSCTIFFGGWFI
jgi:hypothetical protein